MLLKGQAWLSYVLLKYDLTLRELASACFKQNQNALALLYKWKSGKVIPSKGSVNLVAAELPGSNWVYDLPLFDFLSARSLTTKKVRKLVAPYVNEEGFPAWNFPGDDKTDVPFENRRPLVFTHMDSPSLLARGDLYGFIGLLSLVRERELSLNTRYDQFLYVSFFADMVRATSSVARLPWMRDHWELLKICIDSMYMKNLLLFQTLLIDWSVIERQKNEAEFEPCAPIRALKNGTQGWKDIEDPISCKGC